MELILLRGYGYQREIVAHRKRSADGELIGLRKTNPILDTRVYKALFPGGEGIEVSSNRVDESILN